MLLIPIAVAALALGVKADAQAPGAMNPIFAAYCRVPGDAGQPYCTDPVPENVRWLVLYSLCSAKDYPTAFAQVCDAFAKDVAAKDDAERRFLSFDPRFDRWAGATFTIPEAGGCESGTLDAMKWYCRRTGGDWLSIDETGFATVTRAASDDIPVVIVGVNPLLYKTTPETVTSEDIASLESLQQIALGLGTVLQSGIGLLAKAKLEPNVLFGIRQEHLLLEPPSADTQEPSALTAVLELRDEVLQRMAEASKRLAHQAGAAGIARAQAIVAIQDAEQKLGRAGAHLTVTIAKPDAAGTTYAALQAAYDELDTAYRALRDFGEPCRPLLQDFLFIVQHAQDAPSVLRPRLAAFVARHRVHAQCTNEFGALAQQIVSDATALTTLNDADFRTRIADRNTAYNAGLTLIVNPPPRPANAGENDQAPLDAAVTLLTTRRTDALSVYNSLVTAGMRRQDHVFGDTLMMTWLYVAPKTDQLPWSKVQTHVLSLKRNAPLSGAVTGSLAEHTELRYKLQSNKATGIGVGLGVIYTKLSQPEFGAVANPENTDEKVVSQTDTSTLAGQVALFADWRFLSVLNGRSERWLVRPSLQIGTNVSTTPGFFVGIAADVFRYFRFGYGRTFQQSTRLSPSQTVDQTVIASADDIKTEEFFAKDRYLSFSFAIDALPLFRKNDSGGGSSTKQETR
jgi:hypothetical protein